MTQRALFLAGLLAAAAASQDTPAFRSNVELVTIPCTVVDAHGAPVEGLTREDFRVTDNGVRRVIEHLWIDTDQPVTLGLILDASESQQGQFAEHRETALKLAGRLLRPGDRAFAIQVAEDIRLWPDLAGTAAGELFGQPCPKQQSNVPGLRAVSVCGSSPLWNALYDAARLKLLPLTGSKALLILTDGFDTGSTHTWRQAADEAHKAEATVYAIQYPSAFGGSYAPDLYRLVAETGGASFQAPEGDYGPIVSRIETDLRRRYVLGFRPEKLSGKERHEVEVGVTRPDLTVRARKVYFEAPQ
ncbi:MAG TPA: VWA domain-containing protein [Bryobacteraceae bacterium]|nr:VWA domain-containing protein [Bryobacteraceae bacterium]